MSTKHKTPNKATNDVFRAFLVKNAYYEGQEEIPCIKTSKLLPEKVIPFSKAISSKEYDSWVHFYEYDVKFERIWNDPHRYLSLLKKFSGIISPDFSLYYDMPLSMQIWNTYRGKALGHWFCENGIEVIPNVRWSDERTFRLSTQGIEHNKTIAVSTHGCIKSRNEKQMFINGFDYVIETLKPKNIVVHGSMPDKIFCLARMYGIKMICFESEFTQTHKMEVA